MSFTERLTLIALSLGVALALLILSVFPSGLVKFVGVVVTMLSMIMVLWCRERIIANARVVTRALDSGQALVDQCAWYFALLDRLSDEEDIDPADAQRIVTQRVFTRIHLEVDNSLKGNLH